MKRSNPVLTKFIRKARNPRSCRIFWLGWWQFRWDNSKPVKESVGLPGGLGSGSAWSSSHSKEIGTMRALGAVLVIVALGLSIYALSTFIPSKGGANQNSPRSADGTTVP